MIKVKVIHTPRTAGERNIIGEFEFERVPIKGDYLRLPKGQALVEWVMLFSDDYSVNNKVLVAVNTDHRWV